MKGWDSLCPQTPHQDYDKFGFSLTLGGKGQCQCAQGSSGSEANWHGMACVRAIKLSVPP